jgi:hypothetical protein
MHRIRMNLPKNNPARSSQLSEEIFAPALEKRAAALFGALTVASVGVEDGYAERSLYSVSYEAQLLEDYLDRHGASHNKRFHLIRQDVSGIKWVSQALSCLLLIKHGPFSYPVADKDWSDKLLLSHVSASTSRLKEYLDNIVDSLNANWLTADLSLIAQPSAEIEIHPPLPVLPADRVDSREDELEGEHKSLTPRYLSRFIRLYKKWDVKATTRLTADSNAPAFMKKYCTEAIARSFQSKVHNLQSDYDSYLRNTKHELANPRLRQVRGAVSQCLHLLEAVTALTHLYERHRNQEHLTKVLPWEALIALIINHLVLPAYKCIETCIPLAEELLGELSSSGSINVSLPEGVEMHARPLSLIANVVKHHGLEVEIECDGEKANAASFMGMLVLVGSRPETREYRFYGDPGAINDIGKLFQLGLGEKGLEDVVEAFPYLK